MEQERRAAVVGGGPVGCVLAMILARRGYRVDVYEARPDMRSQEVAAGRSINLVLCARGLRALEPFGLRQPVLERTVAVRGRMMHALDGELTYQPYGKDARECNYSISRAELNRFLLDQAEAAGVRLHFQARLVTADLDRGRLSLARGPEGALEEVEAPVVFGCDGAPSPVRAALEAHPGITVRQELLPWGYKELLFPAGPGGAFLMEGHALHIWPRGAHMLMALPNQDGTFTGTVYLPWEGPEGFKALSTPAAVRAFFTRHYPDAIPHLEDLEQSFLDNPTGHLGTIRVNRWHLGGKALLLGDAAHAIVPFFGQGLNCGFEDCAVLERVLADHPRDLAAAFAAFSAARQPDADAIADMALENFLEMRDRVGDEAFIRAKRVEAILERHMPERYRSRYAMVMYSSIPYRLAREVGRIQGELLAELTRGLSDPGRVDLARAESLVAERLTPFVREHELDLSF